jgi:hypothetical protein
MARVTPTKRFAQPQRRWRLRLVWPVLAVTSLVVVIIMRGRCRLTQGAFVAKRRVAARALTQREVLAQLSGRE